MAIEKIEYVSAGFRLNKEMHKEVKMRALEKNMTFQDWLIQAIVEKMHRENKTK